MSNEIISVINALADKLGFAIDWTAENMLPVVQELTHRYARYLLVDNLYGVFLSTVFLLIGVFGFKRTINSYKNKTWAYGEFLGDELSVLGFTAVILFAISIAIGFFAFIFYMGSTLQLIFNPDVAAAKQLIEMLNNAG